MKNSHGAPLKYVIRKNPAPSGIFIDRYQEVMRNYLLQGNMFYPDTKKVLAVLKELPVDNDAETWIKDKLCGR